MALHHFVCQKYNVNDLSFLPIPQFGAVQSWDTAGIMNQLTVVLHAEEESLKIVDVNTEESGIVMLQVWP